MKLNGKSSNLSAWPSVSRLDSIQCYRLAFLTLNFYNMTEIATIIEALFAGDRRKAISYMELFVEKNYPPPALPVHKRTDEQFLAHRLKMILSGVVEGNYTCLDNRVPRELITITELPIEELLESWRNDPKRKQS